MARLFDEAHITSQYVGTLSHLLKKGELPRAEQEKVEALLKAERSNAE